MKKKNVAIAMLAPITAIALSASSSFAAGAPDFQHYGFSKVVAHAEVHANHAATLKYGDLVVDIPAGAFTSNVDFELLEGPLHQFAMNTPKGQSDVVDFAFKVIDAKNMDLIGRFKKPVVIKYTRSCINDKSIYWDVAPNGKLLSNPIKPIIKGHTLIHGNIGAPVGWLITTPTASMNAMSSNDMGSMSNMANMGPSTVIVKNGAFDPSTIHIAKGDTLKFVFDGMGTDHFVIKGVTVSPLVKVGGAWEYKFTKTGSFHVQLADMGNIGMNVIVK